MIFSIICEELGLIGAGFIILLFLILIWRFFVISTKASDLLGALIAAGAMAHMMIQVILNIAVAVSYTHLDVYKRQVWGVSAEFEERTPLHPNFF